MPKVHNPYGSIDRLIIDAPTPICVLCEAPWQDADTCVVVMVHRHTPPTSGDIPNVDITVEFAHEDCCQKFGYERGDRPYYQPTWESCCAKAA